MAPLGGETAEMPGLYPVGEYDLVGTIVGCVQKSKLITGKSIRAGDVIIGFPSGGLQTNGFSLARRVIFDVCQYSWKDKLPGTNQTFGDALLATHKSFLKPVTALLRSVKINGMAHITGGGFPDNIPRVLPKCVNAEIDRIRAENEAAKAAAKAGAPAAEVEVVGKICPICGAESDSKFCPKCGAPMGE